MDDQARGSRAFRLLCAIGLLAFISYDLIRSPLLPLFAQHLGASPDSIGLIVGVSTVTGILFKFPAGTLSDYLGRPRMLLLGLLVFALSPFAYGAVDEVWQLIALRLFHGLATGIFGPVSMAVVVDLFDQRRGEALGWYSAFTQAGRLSGRVLGGYLILWIGFDLTFKVSGIIGIAALVMFFTFKKITQPISAAQMKSWSSPQEFLMGMREVAGDSRVLVTSTMEAFQMLASGALMAFLPLYGISIGLNSGQVGLLFGAQGVASILSKPVMGRVSDQWGRRPLIIGGQLICAVVVAMIPWIETFWILLVLSFLFGLGEAVIRTSTSAMVADLCRTRSFGSAMGVFGTIMDIGHASGPIITGLLITFWGYRNSFATVAFLLILMTFLFVLVVKAPGIPSEGTQSGA